MKILLAILSFVLLTPCQLPARLASAVNVTAQNQHALGLEFELRLTREVPNGVKVELFVPLSEKLNHITSMHLFRQSQEGIRYLIPLMIDKGTAENGERYMAFGLGYSCYLPEDRLLSWAICLKGGDVSAPFYYVQLGTYPILPEGNQTLSEKKVEEWRKRRVPNKPAGH